MRWAWSFCKFEIEFSAYEDTRKKKKDDQKGAVFSNFVTLAEESFLFHTGLGGMRKRGKPNLFHYIAAFLHLIILSFLCNGSVSLWLLL